MTVIRKAATANMSGAPVGRVIPWVLSTPAVDSYGDIVEASGWKFDRFKGNPVVLFGHDSRRPPIGRMRSYGVQGNALVGEVEFAPEGAYDLADTVFNLAKTGFMPAGSVGFQPERYEILEDGGLRFIEQQLVEFSIVTIPANPEALQQARSLGLVEPDNIFAASDGLRLRLIAEPQRPAPRQPLNRYSRDVTVRRHALAVRGQ